MKISFETMVGAHILNENLPVNLQDVCSRELGVTNWGKGVQQFGLTAKKPPTPLWGSEGMSEYNGRDAAYAHLLMHKEAKKIMESEESYALMKNLILPGLEGFLQIELNGIWIDPERLDSRNIELQNKVDDLAEQLRQFVPEVFRDSLDNAGEKKKKWFENDNFVRKWFFGHRPDGLGLQAESFTPETREPTVDKDHLGHFKEHPTVALYLELNDFNTQLKFFDQWREYRDSRSRLHPQFNLTGTVTGRRSCSEPNVMQVPRDKFIRSIIGAPVGWKFLEFDYSQIEVRLAAWFADEETMMEVFRSGGDIYRHTASVAFGIPYDEVTKEQRQNAKPIVLGFLYGMSANSFGEYAYNNYGVKFTSEESVKIRNNFFKAYPMLIKWHEECKLIATRKYEIHSILGRTRHLMNILSTENYERWKAGAQAINSPVQGTGGDLLLMAVGTLAPEINPEEVRLVGDIHDALLVQIRDDVWEKWGAHILDRLEHPPKLALFNVEPPIPLKAECKVGQHWGEGKEWRPETGFAA